MDSLKPTVMYEPASSQPTANRPDVSRANVWFVEGNRPQFSDETATLLRNRLSAAATVMAVTLGLAFGSNLLSGITNLWWLRGIILLVTVVSAIVLRVRPLKSLYWLRVMELAVFGSVVIQLSLMLTIRMSEITLLNNAASLSSTKQIFLSAWCVLIFIYGILMPNTWIRGALVMLPVATLPYLLIAFHSWLSPEMALMLKADTTSSPLPIPLVAAIVATYGTHIINSARREAFRARQFGQYRLLERLGAGGMGEVYKAEHVLLKRPCAIKLIKVASEADAAAIARFEKEVQTTAKLSHWNTIEIYDYGRTDDGTFYYVMELLLGLSLEDLVAKHGPLPPERVIHLLRQVCGALQEAHSVGLIHRDIKPANIFAAQRGGVYDVAKLLDFGLVKEGSEEGTMRNGAFSGTPLFMSPEQASSYEEVDGRADIYSLGAVAYYSLTGQPPFTSKNLVELLAAHRDSQVVPPSRLNGAIPTDLDRVIVKCLAKEPADRFQDAASLMVAFDACSIAQPWGANEAFHWWQSHPLPSSPVAPT